MYSAAHSKTGGGRWSHTITYQTRFYMAGFREQRDWSSHPEMDPNHPNFGADDVEAEKLEPPALIHEYEHFHVPEDSDDQF